MATPRERAFLATPFASPSTRVIASPFQFATDENTNLRIVSANSQVGVVLAIHGRRLSARGEIEPFAFTHTPNTDRSVATQDFKLGAGALLNLSIFASSGAPLIGQTYVMAHLILGLTGATIILGQLLGGYCTAAQPLAYPGSPIQSSIEGGGYYRHITGTDPAAGTEFSETVPTGARWELLALRVTIACNATVAARRVNLHIDDGSTIYLTAPQTDSAGAGETMPTFWAVWSAFSPPPRPDTPIAQLPHGLILLAGHRLRSETDNLQAGDNLSAPQFTAREWLEVSS